MQFRHSALAGIGLLIAIAGAFALLVGAAANRPPVFLLPLGLILLSAGVFLATKHFSRVRQIERDRPRRTRLVVQPELVIRPYPPVGEPTYPYSLDRLPPLLQPLADSVLKLARSSVSLVAERVQNTLPLTASKFGGVPYLPEGKTWPNCRSGKPMTFVGQLNFGDISEIIAARNQALPPEMPTRGILCFFYDMETMTAGFEKGDEDCCRFLWEPYPRELTNLPSVPEQTEPPFECRLVPTVRPGLPSPGDRVFGLDGVTEDVSRAFNEL
jgi:hypothetical protein